MRYGSLHESEARNDYHQKKLINTPLLSVTTTGLHIDTSDCWLAASPDGLVTDPSESTWIIRDKVFLTGRVDILN